MFRLGTTTWHALAWLTAALTLPAGSPRVACRCPSGLVKTFCLGSVLPSTCCVGEQCRPGRVGVQDPRPDGPLSCCSHHRSPSGGSSDESGRLQAGPGGGCVKALLDPLSSKTEPTASDPGDPPAVPFLHADALWGRPADTARSTCGPPATLPPPDPVTRCHRLRC